jgi:hypothetical protein
MHQSAEWIKLANFASIDFLGEKHAHRNIKNLNKNYANRQYHGDIGTVACTLARLGLKDGNI